MNKYPNLAEYLHYRATILEVGAVERQDDSSDDRYTCSRKCHDLANELQSGRPLYLLAKDIVSCLEKYNSYYPGDKALPELLSNLKELSIGVSDTFFVIHFNNIKLEKKVVSLEDVKKEILEVFAKSGTTSCYVTEFDPNVHEIIKTFNVQVTDLKFV